MSKDYEKPLEEMSRKELFKEMQGFADNVEKIGDKIEDLASEFQGASGKIEEIIDILTEGVGGEFLYDEEDNMPSKKNVKELESQIQHMKERMQELESQLSTIKDRKATKG